MAAKLAPAHPLAPAGSWLLQGQWGAARRFLDPSTFQWRCSGGSGQVQWQSRKRAPLIRPPRPVHEWIACRHHQPACVRPGHHASRLSPTVSSSSVSVGSSPLSLSSSTSRPSPAGTFFYRGRPAPVSRFLWDPQPNPTLPPHRRPGHSPRLSRRAKTAASTPVAERLIHPAHAPSPATKQRT